MSASLNNIVSISVEVSNPFAITSDFNLGLIIGKSTAILAKRVKVYNVENYRTQMTSDGFTTDSNEYKAAPLYFLSEENGITWSSSISWDTLNLARRASAVAF